jgi:hypothetical protein
MRGRSLERTGASCCLLSRQVIKAGKINVGESLPDEGEFAESLLLDLASLVQDAADLLQIWVGCEAVVLTLFK